MGGRHESGLCGERWCEFEEKNWKKEDIRADVEIKIEGTRARERPKLRRQDKRTQAVKTWKMKGVQEEMEETLQQERA